MTKKWLILLGLAVFSLSLPSCSDDDGDEEGPGDDMQAREILASLGYDSCSALPVRDRVVISTPQGDALVELNTEGNGQPHVVIHRDQSPPLQVDLDCSASF